MDEAEEVLGVSIVSDDEAAVVVEPGEETFDLPAASVAPERATVLAHASAVGEIGRDEFDPALLEKPFVQAELVEAVHKALSPD